MAQVIITLPDTVSEQIDESGLISGKRLWS